MIKLQKGLTLVEVLVAFMILGILVFAISQMFVSQIKLSGQLDKQNSLVELIQSSIVELDARSVASLPPIGKCSARLFTPNSVFVSETISATASSDCQDIIPSSPGLKVILTVSDIDTSSFKFKNDDGSTNSFLKMPAYVKSLKSVQIQAGMLDPATNKPSQLSMVVYKQ